MTPAWPHGDPRDVVRSILADPRFTGPATRPLTQRWWLDDVRDWIAHLLRGILHGLDHALGAASGLNTAIGFAVIAAALALLAYTIVVGVRLYNRRAPRALGAAAYETLGRVDSATALRTAALGAARDGRFREAAALLFASAVRTLDERGRVAYDPARTPGEYRRILRDPVFDAFTGDAVLAVFGAADPRAELFDRMSVAYDRFFGTSVR